MSIGEVENVKTKNIIVFVAIAWMLGLAGCKPKTTPLSSILPATPQPKSIPIAIPQPKITLTGQMFIVTEGAENVKLGDVEVFLIETVQATDFLQKRQSIVESIIQSRKQAVDLANQDSKEPEAEYELATQLMTITTIATDKSNIDVKTRFEAVQKATDDFDSFSTNSPFATNDNFVTIKKDGDTLLKQICTIAYVWCREIELGLSENITIENYRPNIIEYERAVDEIVYSAKVKCESANSILNLAEITFTNSPTSDDYMAGFSPPFIQKTITDADGKFSFVYPIEKPLTIFAHAQRMIGTKTEQYYWLINAPTNAESASVFLSNHNLITVDPDGYFKIRPKQVN